MYFGFFFLVQPKIFVDGLAKTSFVDGDRITVTCSIPSLRPRISSGKLQMHWSGHSPESSREIDNGDGSYGYIVRMTERLQVRDDGEQIKCIAEPKTGVISEVRKITVECKYNFTLRSDKSQYMH